MLLCCSIKKKNNEGAQLNESKFKYEYESFTWIGINLLKLKCFNMLMYNLTLHCKTELFKCFYFEFNFKNINIDLNQLKNHYAN